MNRLMQFFSYEHLPEYLMAVSRPCALLAKEMDETLPESEEKTDGLRELLKAKDAFVRARLETIQPKETDSVKVKGLISPAHSSVTEKYEK